MRVIKNAKIITPYRILLNKDLLLDDKKIVAIGENLEAEETIDARGLYCSPGFIDIHVHGGNKYDFNANSIEKLREAAKNHAIHGATATYIAMMVYDYLTDNEKAVVATIDQYMKEEQGPEILGIHLEGPFIGDNERKINDISVGAAKRILAEAPNTKIVTISPEFENSKDIVRFFNENGVRSSLGHCKAPTYMQIEDCIEAGANQVTHLYSDTNPIYRIDGVRYPGLNEMALANNDLYTEIVGDGVHLSGKLIEIVSKFKGIEKIILVSDGQARPDGVPDGTPLVRLIDWGEGENRRKCIHTEAPMDYVVRNVYQNTKLPIQDVVRMATLNPALANGVANRKGVLAPGYDADILLFDEDINIKTVIARGKKVFDELV